MDFLPLEVGGGGVGGCLAMENALLLLTLASESSGKLLAPRCYRCAFATPAGAEKKEMEEKETS